MRTFALIILISAFVSCAEHKRTRSGYTIKGHTEIVFDEIDKSLNSKSIVCGYVYSKNSKEFIAGAFVKIGNEKYITDENGFFSAKINPGIYSISTNFIGNTEQKISNLKVAENHKIIIVFKLGTEIIY